MMLLKDFELRAQSVHLQATWSSETDVAGARLGDCCMEDLKIASLCYNLSISFVHDVLNCILLIVDQYL